MNVVDPYLTNDTFSRWFTVTAAESRHEQDIEQSSSSKEWLELDRVTSDQLRITEGISLWQGMNSIL